MCKRSFAADSAATHADVLSHEWQITYSYDNRNQLTAYTQTGDTHSSASYAYDAKGQKTQETVTYGEGQGSFSLSTRTHYTGTGQKERFTYPDGTQIDYTYTNNGLLHTATLPNDSGSIHWQTYQWQQPTTIILPGAVRTLAYDALQRPIHIKSQAIGQGTPQTPAGQIIMDYRYTYDAAGNITQRQTEEGSYQYAYDLIDRLTHATPPQHLQQNPITPEADKLPVEAYSYDPVHNRLSSQHQPGPWQYNQDNQLQSYGVGIERRSYTYTPNGHTATETTGDPAIKTREFIYNAAERLIEIKDNNQTIGQYQYDPMGRRIKKHTPEGTTWFLYSDEGLIAEVDPTGNPTRYYGWKPNGLWGTDPLWLADKTTTAQNTWQPHLYHNDHLGLPFYLGDINGCIVWKGRSDSFGNVTELMRDVDNYIRLPGQYFDSEAGFHYNYFRNYLQSIGRYIQSDPAGLFDGTSLYSYARNRPFNYIDPLGLYVICVTEDVPVTEYNLVTRQIDVVGFKQVKRCKEFPDPPDYECEMKCEDLYNRCVFYIDIIPQVSTGVCFLIGGGRTIGMLAGGLCSAAASRIDLNDGYEGCKVGRERCLRNCRGCE